MRTKTSKPLVLAIGGHDPSGGAGIQADIETIAANSCHALTLITALTTQNTCRVSRMLPLSGQQLEMQFRLLLEESRIAAIKIGLVGSVPMADTLGRLLSDYPEVPTVLDPVLTSGSGMDLADDNLPLALTEHLLPYCTLVTPNSQEARKLSGEQNLDACAHRLIGCGSSTVLITGGHEPETGVINRLYGLGGPLGTWEWPRLPHNYHGSGCTLASAITAGLAHELPLTQAVELAQDYTWNSLQRGFRSGHCQLTPDRFHHMAVGETE